MARFNEVNREVKKAFPNLDIEVVRGEGYVYFTGDSAYVYDVESIFTHPVNTSTEDLVRMCKEEISSVI